MCEELISRKVVLNLRKYNLVGGIHTVNVADIEKLPTIPQTAIKHNGEMTNEKKKEMLNDLFHEIDKFSYENREGAMVVYSGDLEHILIKYTNRIIKSFQIDQHGRKE